VFFHLDVNNLNNRNVLINVKNVLKIVIDAIQTHNWNVQIVLMNLISIKRINFVSLVFNVLEKGVGVAIQQYVRIVYLVTILTNLKLLPTKEIVHHVGKNMINVSNVASKYALIAKVLIFSTTRLVNLVLVIAFHATLLNIVSNVTRIFL